MTQSTDQNYANHRQFVPLYHGMLTLIGLVALVGSVALLYRTFQAGHGRLAAGCIFLLVVIGILEGYFLRAFALKAQDRAIRAEENLRHYVLQGRLLDPRLTIRQIIGLRFACDDELGPLAQRAAEEELSENEIKKSVGSWRADGYRV
jgi:Family of unknown function (DUF6526)